MTRQGRKVEGLRSCGDCQLCCYLLPVAEGAAIADYGMKIPIDIPGRITLNKPALQKCQHQRFKKGCSIYPNRPISCRDWSCAWLTNNLHKDMPRPDKAGYVVDPRPDTITYIPEDNPDTTIDVPVFQVWIDTRKVVDRGKLILKAGFGPWLEDVFKQGMGVLFREGSRKGYVIFEYGREILAGEGTLSPSAGQLKDAFTTFVK